MSPIIKWLLAKSQMQKAAIGGVYRGAGGPAANPLQQTPLQAQASRNQVMAPLNAAGAAVGSYTNPLNNLKNMAALPGQYAKGVQAAGTALGDAAGTAYGALNNYGGGKGFRPPSGVPAVSYNTGMGSAPQPVAARPPVASGSPQLSLADAGKEVNQAMRRTISSGRPGPSASQIQMAPQTRIADDPTYRAPKPATASKPQTPANSTPASMQGGQSEMNPSDRAKAIFAQVNQRRRDAAFGRGTFSAADEKALMDQGNSLLNQSNTMRNAPGYKPDANSMHPRDQADVVRQRLNSMRSSAGGEVPQSGQMMRQLNQFNAAADAMPAPKMPGGLMIPGKPKMPGPGGLIIPGRPSQRPSPMPMQRSPMQEPMMAKASTAFRFGAFLGAQ